MAFPQAKTKAGGRASVTGRAGRPRDPALWIGGGAACAGALCLRLFGGSPRTLLHALDAGDVLPPLWLLGLLSFGAAFALGGAAGLAVVSRPGGGARAADRFRGGMYAVLSAVCAGGWYLLLVRAGSLWLSLILLVLSFMTVVPCAVSWFRLSVRAGACCVLYALWCLWVMILQTVLVLRA